MEVVAEDGELDEAEPEPLARIGEALFDRTEAALASQVPHARGDAQRDEHEPCATPWAAAPSACARRPFAFRPSAESSMRAVSFDWGEFAKTPSHPTSVT